ncbi:hypothetical protein PF005_g13769 [Phytophthora fragariae]|nr:hypothetical protein PF009_g15083 [Phytophthora fragariae]KAE9003754.1 hypothetical protein PF011_g12770 [Phytophthora fragariae]KAE9104100.1 hypothetical protein PF010_g13501 [Phytophthora fragariae]KAE9104283.1 hypothetical protein PF007_g14106 [Phytophthora fragariae]KAE9141852.1 hypothetical protein PF006_g12993 [Phytophthora fragariae]
MSRGRQQQQRVLRPGGVKPVASLTASRQAIIKQRILQSVAMAWAHATCRGACAGCSAASCHQSRQCSGMESKQRSSACAKGSVKMDHGCLKRAATLGSDHVTQARRWQTAVTRSTSRLAAPALHCAQDGDLRSALQALTARVDYSTVLYRPAPAPT